MQRDSDQVVYRYQMMQQPPSSHGDESIIMVDQLWMWRLGDGLILTCFPQRWQQPRNDPYNVLDRIIEDINSKSRDPVQNVDDLALAIVNRCSRAFDDYSSAGGGPSFLNMFDLSLGHVMDKETQLFSRFRRDSLVAASYLRPAQARRQAKSLSVYSDKDARRGLLAAVEPCTYTVQCNPCLDPRLTRDPR